MNYYEDGKDYPIGPFLYCSFDCRKAAEKQVLTEGKVRVEMDFKMCRSGDGGCDWCGSPLLDSEQLRFTVVLSKKQTERLKQVSHKTGESINVLVRKALCEQLTLPEGPLT
jgi:hypothetical protein